MYREWLALMGFVPHIDKVKKRFDDALNRVLWCPKEDLNRHTRWHMDLNHARLPIPPFGLYYEGWILMQQNQELIKEIIQ